MVYTRGMKLTQEFLVGEEGQLLERLLAGITVEERSAPTSWCA